MYYDPANDDGNVESLLKTLNDHFIIPNFTGRDGRSVYTKVYRSRFTLGLIKGVLATIEKLDSGIVSYLNDGSSISRLDSMVLQSLRLAHFELTNSNLSGKIIVSEYVDIVAEFCDKDYTAFANKVLDRMASDLRGQRKNGDG
jgi:transcription termination factor NusB